MVVSRRVNGYLVAAAVGAIGGGLVVAITTKAVPRIMAGMMKQMMPAMMNQMKECGCSPET
jgi:hypothetical protein